MRNRGHDGLFARCERDGKWSLSAIGYPSLQPIAHIDFTKPRSAHNLHMDKDVSIMIFADQKSITFQSVKPFYRDRFEIARHSLQSFWDIRIRARTMIRVIHAILHVD